MAFTVADERCSISSFFFRGGLLLLGQRRNLIFWNQQTTKTLSVFAQNKRGTQNKRFAICSVAVAVVVVVRRASSPLESGSFRAVRGFSLSPSPFEAGVNRKE